MEQQGNASGPNIDADMELMVTVAKAKSPESNGKVLQTSAAVGEQKRVQALLLAGADVNFKDTNGATALHYALRGGQVEIASLLLESGADVKAADKTGLTPLHVAAQRGKEDAVELILEVAGVDISAKDKFGATPLDHARLWQQTAAAQVLAEAGALAATTLDSSLET